MLEIRTFGGLRITRAGKTIAGFTTRKVEALLVYLACQGRPCARELLADLLWDDRPQAQAQANLRAALSRLNRLLPGVLTIERQAIAITAGQVWLDVAALENALETALETGLARPDTEPDQAELALALYAGDFLAGYGLRESRGFDDWLLLERERLRNRVLDALAALIHRHLNQQRYLAGLPLARRLVALDPLREEGRRLLMTLLALTGERGAALAEYEACRQVLVAELAVAPSVETSRLRQQIERGEIAPAPSASRPPTGRAPLRLINPLPQEIGGRYVGQAEKQAAIKSAIVQGARLISLYGRGGIGKTALACQVLADLQLQLDPAPVAGIVALSALTGGIRLDRILIDLGRLLPRQSAELLSAVARDPQASTAQKINVLLEQIRGSRYLLFLDNLETLQDPASGALMDPELQTFLETVVAQSEALCLLVTSREPLALPRTVKTWERAIPLTEGLPPAEAGRLLRAFDPTGAAGLRDAPEALLGRLAERTHGFPRALEAVAGLLLETPLLRPEELADDPALWAQEVTPAIVQQAIARLDPPAARALQALALFGSPVSRAGLEFLLLPFIPPVELASLLNRLVRAFLVRLDPMTRDLTLHPLDQEYCYSQIPDGDASFSRRPLHQRAAQFFHHQRRPQSEWSTVDDLAAPLAEFEHRIQAGEFDAAAEVLLLMDRDYLWEWGQKARLQAMHIRLQGHLADPRLARASRRRLAWTHWPDIPTVAPIFETNLAEARRDGDRAGEADALDDLAQVGRFQVDPHAVELHEQALAIYRELGDRRGEGDALGGAASVYMGMGQAERAIDYCQQAIRIHRELNHQPSLAYAFWMLASSYAFLGQFEQARACGHTALGIYQEINAPAGRAMALGSLAQIHCMLGEFDQAFAIIDEADGLNYALQSVEGINVAHMGRGIALTMQGKAQEAVPVLQAVLASGIRNQVTLGFATHYLIQALLATGRLGEAQGLLARRSRGWGPGPVAIFTNVLEGILYARLNEPDHARALFAQALADAEPLRQQSSRFRILYAYALARAGLAVVEGADDWLEQARADVAAAVAECHAPGLARQHRQMLEALMVCPGGERLVPLRDQLLAAER